MKKKLLIIDDKDTIAKLISIFLKADFDSIYMESAIKAINWLQEGNMPDLIISDMRMPEMSGSEFLDYVKNNELFKGVPVVMLSGVDSTQDRINMLEKGAADYIVKPFNPAELKIRIKNIVS